jgi:hypothetical protein
MLLLVQVWHCHHAGIKIKQVTGEDGVTNVSAASNLAVADGRSKMATNPQIILIHIY